MTTKRTPRLANVGGPIVAFAIGAATSSIPDRVEANHVGHSFGSAVQ